MKRFSIAALTLLAAIAFGVPSPASAAENQDEQGETVLYLGEDRLVILRFQVLIDGKPYREAWEAFLDERFEKLDENQDGELAGKERNALPSPRLLTLLRIASGSPPRPAPATMNRRAFGEYLEQVGFRPFRVDIQSPPNQSDVRLSFGGMQQDPDQAAKILFAHLDADSDERLTRAEMESAIGALHKQDLDQDETISSAELIPVNLPFYAAPRGGPAPQEDQTAFVSLTDGTSSRQAISRLMAKYDADAKDNALSRDELGMADALFSAHDIDGNGKWDFEEIQQFLRSPSADVTATVRLGKRAGDEPVVALEHDKALSSDVKNAIGSLNMGTVQMEVSTTTNQWTVRVEESLKRRLQSADADGNGYVDQQEVPRLGLANQLFSELDRDKDEKLFPEEFVAVLLPIAETATRQISLTITDGGRDLFRILDTSGDGRLSVREFWAMADRAELWDRDDDGRIAQSEIPQQYRLSVGRASGNLLSALSPQAVVVSNPGGSPVRRTTTGPMWFQRMDRNGDGDISRREFLGTPQDFQKLDQDADGLISADEARPDSPRG